MSYARRGLNSDVYVFASDHGLHCHECSRGLGNDAALAAHAMATHLREHIAAGDNVPPGVILEILADAAPKSPPPESPGHGASPVSLWNEDGTINAAALGPEQIRSLWRQADACVRDGAVPAHEAKLNFFYGGRMHPLVARAVLEVCERHAEDNTRLRHEIAELREQLGSYAPEQPEAPANKSGTWAAHLGETMAQIEGESFTRADVLAGLRWKIAEVETESDPRSDRRSIRLGLLAELQETFSALATSNKE